MLHVLTLQQRCQIHVASNNKNGSYLKPNKMPCADSRSVDAVGPAVPPPDPTDLSRCKQHGMDGMDCSNACESSIKIIVFVIVFKYLCFCFCVKIIDIQPNKTYKTNLAWATQVIYQAIA